MQSIQGIILFNHLFLMNKLMYLMYLYKRNIVTEYIR